VNLAVHQCSITDAWHGRSRTRPWAGVQVVGVATANALAIAAALVAWWAASGTSKATEQIAFSSLALVGAVIALASNTWFLARGRQMVRVAQRAVMAERRFAPFRSDAAAPAPNGSSERRSQAVPPAGGQYLTVPGTSRYHRPSCPLVAQKDSDAAPRSVHEQAGRQACEVCEP
jgi:hypothetical protein